VKQQDLFEIPSIYQGKMIGPGPALPLQVVRAQAENQPIAQASGATGPTRRNRVPRSRRLWSQKDGFTMSGTSV